MSAVEDLTNERRITFCLYEYWEKLANEQGLPALKNMKKEEIAPFKKNLALIDLRNGQDNPTFQVIGSALQEDLDGDLCDMPISSVPRRTMLSRVTDHYLEVLANRVPIAFEAEFVNSSGEKALYRGILLPFSDDNQNINFILGGVRWILEKDVTLDDTQPTIEELMKNISGGEAIAAGDVNELSEGMDVDEAVIERAEVAPEEPHEAAATEYEETVENFSDQADIDTDEGFSSEEIQPDTDSSRPDEDLETAEATDMATPILDALDSTNDETEENESELMSPADDAFANIDDDQPVESDATNKLVRRDFLPEDDNLTDQSLQSLDDKPTSTENQEITNIDQMEDISTTTDTEDPSTPKEDDNIEERIAGLQKIEELLSAASDEGYATPEEDTDVESSLDEPAQDSLGDTEQVATEQEAPHEENERSFTEIIEDELASFDDFELPTKEGAASSSSDDSENIEYSTEDEILIEETDEKIIGEAEGQEGTAAVTAEEASIPASELAEPDDILTSLDAEVAFTDEEEPIFAEETEQAEDIVDDSMTGEEDALADPLAVDDLTETEMPHADIEEFPGETAAPDDDFPVSNDISFELVEEDEVSDGEEETARAQEKAENDALPHETDAEETAELPEKISADEDPDDAVVTTFTAEEDDGDDLSIEELMQSIITDRKFDQSYQREQQAKEKVAAQSTLETREEVKSDEDHSEAKISVERLLDIEEDIPAPLAGGDQDATTTEAATAKPEEVDSLSIDEGSKTKRGTVIERAMAIMPGFSKSAESSDSPELLAQETSEIGSTGTTKGADEVPPVEIFTEKEASKPDSAEYTDEEVLIETEGVPSFEHEFIEEITSSDEDTAPTQGKENESEYSIEPEDEAEETVIHSFDELQSILKQIVGYIKKEDANHNRSRDSLYNILTAIYEFHESCENSPDAYQALVKQNDLKVQSRAPFTPVLKICLGKDYDKTRLTEYAAALSIARYMNVGVGEFHAFIKNFPGGIKGCVKEMRIIRKHGASGNLTERQTRSVEEAREILHNVAPIANFRLKKVIVGNNTDDFCLLLAKRDGHDINVLKIIDEKYTKLDPILKRVAFIKGNLNDRK